MDSLVALVDQSTADFNRHPCFANAAGTHNGDKSPRRQILYNGSDRVFAANQGR